MSESLSPLDEAPALNGRFLSAYASAEIGPGPTQARRPMRLQATAPVPNLADPLGPAYRAPELILGENSLLPFHFLRTGDRLGRAVVKIRRADGASGTGFLVAPDILLTNHHVLPDAATAAKARVLANYEPEPHDTLDAPHAPPVEVALAPSRLFVTEAELDFTFCGVEEIAGLGAIPLDRADSAPAPADVVNIIQHPRGRPKEVAIRDNQVIKSDGVVLHYVCDTEPGSSGSPVFDSRWRLVALHHASVLSTDAGGGRRSPGMSPDARFLNEGIRLSAIARWLDSDARSLAGSVGLDRVRALFRGLDARAGFFGALGRRPSGRSAAEFVAAAETGAIAAVGGALDVAFWDLRALRDEPLASLADLGAAMAAMAMDVWFLAHATTAQARVLAEHLDAFFGREHRVIASRPPVAVLGRSSRSAVVEPIGDDAIARVRARVRLGGAHGGAPAEFAAVDLLPLFDLANPSAPEQIVARAEEPGDALLIGGNAARLRAAELAALAGSGLDLHEASGPGGGIILMRGAGSRIGRVYTTPGLTPRSDLVRTVADRQAPEPAGRIAGRAPVATRIVFE